MMGRSLNNEPSVSTSLILIRHAESQKNTTPTFSTQDGAEKLTEHGIAQAQKLGEFILPLMKDCDEKNFKIYCSPTARCIGTGEMILGDEGFLKLAQLERLAPILSPYPGLTEQEVWDINPEFMLGVNEYRKGLKSAYDIPRGSGEEIREFEQRVISAVMQLIQAKPRILVVIAHRSTITAILLWAARALYGYPDNWYGHVPISLGSLTKIEIAQQGVVSISSNTREFN